MLTDLELLQADVESRARALNVERSAIVQAPAGSGKTELLIQRYLKLLAIVTSPEEILAITFTRKASWEMQNRVIDALRLARAGTPPDADYELITYEAATAVLARDRALDWNLIESPGRMRIQTVDAFSAGIARALPLSSGLGGIGSTVTGEEMSHLYRMAAAATLDSLQLDNPYGEVVERVLIHLDGRTGLYISHLARMLAYRDQWLAITGSGLADPENAGTVRRRLERNIGQIVARELAGIRSSLPNGVGPRLLKLIAYASHNLLDAGKTQHPLCELGSFTELPGSTARDRTAWQAIAGLLLTKGGDWRKTINKNDGFPPGDAGQKQDLNDLIAELRDVSTLQRRLDRTRALPPAEYVDEQWQVLLALFRLLPLAVVELQRLFGERGISDHIQVALAANRALGTDSEPGEIALALDYNIRHLLIDEMQDTSISQYGMLMKLTGGWSQGDGKTLFCVGDPMQSIYRFRDAEVGQFLLAREKGIGGIQMDSLILRRNFRSGEHLVHWFNTVFDQVFPEHDDVSAGAISYSASVPVEAHADSGEFKVHPLFGKTAEEEAQHTLSVIANRLESSPGEYIAVLVRSRTTLSALLYELRGANIAYQAIEIDRLTDLPEIIDLLALTRALCHEGDRLAWLALLRGPWVGLTWEDIHALVRNDSRGTVAELLRDDERLARLSDDGARRVADFRKGMATAKQGGRITSLRERVEKTWYSLGGPFLISDGDQLDNIYKFLDVIEKIESAGNLADIRDLERVLDQERVSSKADANCRLQIMTMHKAKGLQFDHVILHGLGRTAKSSDKAVLSWTSDPIGSGNNEMIISPLGPQSDLDSDPLHRFIETIEKEKERYELDRVLYVACTRARISLHLIGNVGLAQDGQSYHKPPATSLLHRLWPAIEVEFERAFVESGIAEESPEFDSMKSNLVVPRLRRLTGRPAYSLPDLPAPSPAADGAQSETGAAVSYEWVGATARYAGTIVHRWLQRISDGKATIGSAGVGEFRDATLNWATRLGVGAEDLDTVCERVMLALGKVASDKQGQWLLSGEGKSEYSLTGFVAGRVQSIVIDRVRIDDSGVHWIVDYKTGTHEGGDLQGFLAQETERHRPQLEKYAAIYNNLTDAPVRVALYFPLLQEFCEVELQE